MTCRYPIPEEYIAVLITDQGMMEIAFAVVASPRYSLELYIDANVENTHYIGEYPTDEYHLIPSNIVFTYSIGTSYMHNDDGTGISNDMMTDDDNGGCWGVGEWPT